MITPRVLDEILLVVFCRIAPFSSLEYLGNYLLLVGVEVVLLHLIGHIFGDIFLRRRVAEDSRAVFRPTVVPLPVESCRIMRSVKEFNEFSIRYDVWVEHYPHSLSVARGARGTFRVARVVGLPSDKSNTGLKDTFIL